MNPVFSLKIYKTLAFYLAALAMGSASAQPGHEKNGHEKSSHGNGNAHGNMHGNKYGHGRENGYERYVFRSHDTRHFQHNDLIRWRGGRWNNSCFNSRCGWWWLAAGQWYFYERPTYPYPLVVSNIEFAEPTYVVPSYPEPAHTPVAPTPVIVPARDPAPGPQFWYYCDNPQGYFPSVQTCAIPFRQVPPPPAPLN